MPPKLGEIPLSKQCGARAMLAIALQQGNPSGRAADYDRRQLAIGLVRTG